MDRRTFLKLASLALTTLAVGTTASQLGLAGESDDRESLSMEKPLIGVSAYPGAVDAALMKDAGIGWIRHHFPYPFQRGASGPLSEAYLVAKAQAAAWHREGMEILGVTPMLATIWPSHRNGASLFDCGQAGSEDALESYRTACALQAEDLRGIVKAWQVANEVDLPPFAGALNLRQACQMVLHGARGLKRSNPNALVGTNSAALPHAYYVFGYLYGRPYEKESPFDYCGDDGYYGSFHPGGPEQWGPRLTELEELTEMPVMVNEWGFHSSGDTMTDSERESIVASMTASEREFGVPACGLRKLPYTWGGGHTPEVQAEYITAAFGAFSQHSDKLAGIVFYCWQDEERCHYCGSPNCPVTSRQGLLDVEGRPKPGYYAFRDAARTFLSDAPTGA